MVQATTRSVSKTVTRARTALAGGSKGQVHPFRGSVFSANSHPSNNGSRAATAGSRAEEARTPAERSGLLGKLVGAASGSRFHRSGSVTPNKDSAVAFREEPQSGSRPGTSKGSLLLDSYQPVAPADIEAGGEASGGDDDLGTDQTDTNAEAAHDRNGGGGAEGSDRGDSDADADGSASALPSGRRSRSARVSAGGDMEATLSFDSGGRGDSVDLVSALYNAMSILSASLAIVSMGIRFYCRARGWADNPQWVPYDAELLAISTWLGYLYLLFYVRCFRHVGRLVIALVQIVLDDVAKVLFICASNRFLEPLRGRASPTLCTAGSLDFRTFAVIGSQFRDLADLLLLLGFTLAFRVLMYADCPATVRTFPTCMGG